MDRWNVAQILRTHARVLEFHNENRYKVRAFRKAADTVEWSQGLETMRVDELKKLPNIGEKIASLIADLLKEDKNILQETDLYRDVPPQILKEGAKKPIFVVMQLAKLLKKTLLNLDGINRIEVVGDVRRGVEMVSNILLMVEAGEQVEVTKQIIALDLGSIHVDSTEDSLKMNLAGMPIVMYLVNSKEWAMTKFELTGSQRHVDRVKNRACTNNTSAEARGESGIHLVDSEVEIYHLFGLQYVPPELREGNWEIRAAEQGIIPPLLETSDIKGDLHVHSNWSDGQHSILQMAQQAEAKGYQYLAICDHSKSLGIANGLDEKALHRQQQEIDIVNSKLDRIRVLKGIECDILKDGTLDLTDDILDELDFVVAALHSGFNTSGASLTSRAELALKNPNVDLLAHPTGRILDRREAYAIDVAHLIEIAAQNQTALEINADPLRLDLEAKWAKYAIDEGAKLVINSDAHNIEELDNMFYGVLTARRAGLTSEDIANCYNYEDLDFLPPKK